MEFEEELAEKFGGSSPAKEVNHDADNTEKGPNFSQAVSDIKKKYEKKLAANQGSGTDVCIRIYRVSYKFSWNVYDAPFF